jgi:hypothetical protein
LALLCVYISDETADRKPFMSYEGEKDLREKEG